MNNLLLVFIGGGIGSCLRYLMQFVFNKSDGMSFPFSTFIVNILGCLAIGIIAGMIYKYKLNGAYGLLLVTGLLGGFTTFSSFGLEFVQLLKNNQTGIALLYAIMSNFVGLALAALGLYVIK
jgi:fluoride exporter